FANCVSGMITHDAVDHDLETEHGDPGYRNDGHEALGAVHTIGSSECDSPDDGHDQGNEKRRGNRDPVNFQGARSLPGTNRSCAAIPLQSPEQQDGDAERGAEVLQDVVDVPGPEKGKHNRDSEEGQMIARPVTGVSE